MDETKDLTDALQKIRKQTAAEKWFIDNGLIAESLQQNLIAFGYGSHPKVITVELDIDLNKKAIVYNITLPLKENKRYLAFQSQVSQYVKRGSLFAKWRLLKLLRKNEDKNIELNIKRCVKEYLPGFTVSIITKGVRMPSTWLFKLLGIQ